MARKREAKTRHPSGLLVSRGELGPPGIIAGKFRPRVPATESLASCTRCRRLVLCFTFEDGSVYWTDPLLVDRIFGWKRLEWALTVGDRGPESLQLWGDRWGTFHRCPGSLQTA